MFAWDAPTLPLKLIFEFEFDNNTKYRLSGVEINIDEIDSEKAIIIHSKDGDLNKKFVFYSQTFIEGSIKKLRFFKSNIF